MKICPDLFLHIRWEANSYGYHGDDGYLYRGQGKGEKFGPTPTYTANDTVGGGIIYQLCFPKVLFHVSEYAH